MLNLNFNQMKTRTFKISPAIMVAIGMGILAVFGSVKAYQNYSNAPKVVVEGNYIEAPSAQSQQTEQSLGAVTSNVIESDHICVNGVCTYYKVVTFTDATTTIISIPDPFLTVTTTGAGQIVLQDDGVTEWAGATTTVDLVRLDITGAATTTYQVTCGATAASVDVATPSPALLSSGVVATSTLGVIESNVSQALGGFVDGGTTAKIMLGNPKPYFSCLMTSVSSTAALTSTGNSFDGKATVRFSRSR